MQLDKEKGDTKEKKAKRPKQKKVKESKTSAVRETSQRGVTDEVGLSTVFHISILSW